MKPSLSMIFLGQDDSAPSISVCPSAVVALGGNVTIRCKSEIYQQKKFVLIKSFESQENVMEEKEAEKYEVTFSIANAKYLDGGSYWCHFEISPQEWSHYSKKARIWIREQIYPKPSILVSPKELVPLGKSVTIHCKNEDNSKAHYSFIKEGARRIIEFKTGDEKGAVFTIDNVDQSKVGIYWCDYRPYRDYRYSHFSERVYINITDSSLSKPSLKITSTEQTSSGFNVTIECQGPEMGLIFSLHKSEDLKATQEETDRNATAFQIIMKELEDARHYTCQYCHKGNPFVWSELSDPLEQDRNDSITIIVWVRIAVGCLILVFLLLLITCNLIRKRKKESTAEEARPYVNMIPTFTS